MNSKLAPYRDLLQTSQWFSSQPATLQQALLERAELRLLAAGENLFRRGDRPCGLYAVLEGALNVGAVDASGREALLTVAEPVTWFGEISLFDGLPRTHDAVAAGATLLLHIPQPALDALLAAEPAYWRNFALLMTQKLRLSFINAEDLSLLPAAPRLARRLLMIAEGYGASNVVQSRIKISQERLALLLSLSRQTVNQLLKELEAQGMVRLQFGEIEILDRERLREAAAGR